MAPTKTRNAKRNAKRNITAERNSGILKYGTKLLKGETELLKCETELLKCETEFLTKKKSISIRLLKFGTITKRQKVADQASFSFAAEIKTQHKMYQEHTSSFLVLGFSGFKQSFQF